MDDREELLGSFLLVSCGLAMWIKHMMPHMTFDDFRHQPSERSPTRGDGVEDATAVLLLRLDGSFDGFDLAFDAPDPADELLLLEMEMCHCLVVYPLTVYSMLDARSVICPNLRSERGPSCARRSFAVAGNVQRSHGEDA